jgi:hypothetical protein
MAGKKTIAYGFVIPAEAKRNGEISSVPNSAGIVGGVIILLSLLLAVSVKATAQEFLYHQALMNHNINTSSHTPSRGGHGIPLTKEPASAELWLQLKKMNFLKPCPFK